jgi:hypothetical protein
MTIYVEIMGYLYKPSKANYRRWLNALATGTDTERNAANDYLGREVGKVVRASDLWTREEAAEKLTDLLAKS